MHCYKFWLRPENVAINSSWWFFSASNNYKQINFNSLRCLYELFKHRVISLYLSSIRESSKQKYFTHKLSYRENNTEVTGELAPSLQSLIKKSWTYRATEQMISVRILWSRDLNLRQFRLFAEWRNQNTTDHSTLRVSWTQGVRQNKLPTELKRQRKWT